MVDKEATGTLAIIGGTVSGTASWRQLGSDIDGEAAYDHSGGNLSLSADGSTVAIGAKNNDGNDSNSGHVRIYQRNNTTNVWEQLGADIDGEAAGDWSGWSVSLSADGSVVAIGAGNNDGNGAESGHVRIYQYNSAINAWEQLGTDIDGEAGGDLSGRSISLSADGSTVAIGAQWNDDSGINSGHVRIYQRNSDGNWQQVGADIDGETAGDFSGSSVSLSADGSTVAIGAIWNAGNGTDSGHVRIYQRNAVTNAWEQVGADIDGEAADDESGESVSLSADGSTIAIGAAWNDRNGTNSGHVRIYQRNSDDTWEQVGFDIDGEAAGDYSGESVSLSADGSTVAIGATGNHGNGIRVGHVRIYQHKSNGHWEQVGADIDGEADDDSSGGSVSLSADGSIIAIGASANDGNGINSGHVRIYELETPTHQAQQGTILSANLADVLDADGLIQSTAYQWQSSRDNGVTWADLNETSQQLDTSAPSLVGQDIRVTATTIDALGGSTSFTSAALNITADTNPPVFTSTRTAAAIDDNSGSGQVIYTATAIDNFSVAYSLKSNNNDDAESFSIDSASGEVTLTANPVYATQSSYSFTVIATDEAGNFSEQSISLAVFDELSSVFTSGGIAAALDENSGAGQVVYTATVKDNISVSYSLKANNNDDASFFSINSATGQVSLEANPDHETQSAYSFIVIATDDDGNTSEQLVSLAINDRDDAATGTLTIAGDTSSVPASWHQLGSDIDGEAARDESGWSVSLSADGSTVAIGAPYNASNGNDSGHVRIYQRNSNSHWEQVGADIDGEAAGDWSGQVISLSADGSTVAIGAKKNDGNGTDSGHVRIYQRNSDGNWFQVGADIDGEAASDWSGHSVSISANGSTVAVGAPLNDGNGNESGHVRIYERNSNGNWEQVGADIDGELADDRFGWSVSLSADGMTVAIGAPISDAYADGYIGPSNVNLYTGEVYIYQRNSNNNWEQVGNDIQGEFWDDQAGYSVLLSADGSTVASASPYAPNRIYQRNSNGDWEKVGGDIKFGHSIALSTDGSTVAVGNSSGNGNGSASGHVRVYQRSSEGYWEQVGTDIDGEAAYNYSGESISISADGSIVAIGAPFNYGGNGTDPYAGHVRIYQRNTPIQAQQGTILSANLTDILDVDGAIQSTTYQWQSSSDNGANWSVLSGETNQQIDTSSQSLVGQDVRVIATTTDASGGSTSFTSAAVNITADTDAPIFTSSATAAAVDENSGAGQVVYTATATDNTSVGYSLKANNNDDAFAFSIDSVTGEVSLEIDPDYETQSSYSFTVVATDVAGNSSQEVISLDVNDIVEFPTLKSIHAVKSRKKKTTFSLYKPLKLQGQKLGTAIVGTNKRDRIIGTYENEILAGFKGKDVLKGGGGADGFLFDKPIGFGKKQMDKILDFDYTEGDKILVDKKAFGLGRKLKLKSVKRKNDLGKFAKKKFDFIYESRTGSLYFNENGKRPGFGRGGLFAQLQGKPYLIADDFRIV